MEKETPVVLRLELDEQGDAIRGRLSTEAGRTLAFIGWLGLAAALEQATERPET